MTTKEKSSVKENAIAVVIFLPIGGLILWLSSFYDKKRPWESAKVIGSILFEIFKWLAILGIAVWIVLGSYYWIKGWLKEREELRSSPIFKGFYRLTALASGLPILLGFGIPIIFTEMMMEDKIAWIMGCFAVAAIPWILFGVSVFVVDGFREKKPS